MMNGYREMEIIKHGKDGYTVKVEGKQIWRDDHPDSLLNFIDTYCFNTRAGVYVRFVIRED